MFRVAFLRVFALVPDGLSAGLSSLAAGGGVTPVSTAADTIDSELPGASFDAVVRNPCRLHFCVIRRRVDWTRKTKGIGHGCKLRSQKMGERAAQVPLIVNGRLPIRVFGSPHLEVKGPQWRIVVIHPRLGEPYERLDFFVQVFLSAI